MEITNRFSSGWCKALFATALSISTCVAAAEDRLSVRNLQQISVNSNIKLETPISRDAAGVNIKNKLDSSLENASGRVQVIVRLKSEATTEMAEDSAFTSVDQKYVLENEQDGFVNRSIANDSSIRVIGRVQHVLNAVFLDVPASSLKQLANDAAVIRIAPVKHYEMDLSETVPYIGGKFLHDRRIKGKGIKVAVLDSGIDYTHADLGGSGDIQDYLNNNPDIIEPGTFPTAKVKGGYDFVGSTWPNGPGGAQDPPDLDPDPFDDNFGGHGTHVGDIIAGVNGVAPEAELYAVKVCSSVASSCNGISMLLGLDWALDPDGDGDISDRVDIVNMSLGSDYGLAFDDDMSTAVDNASAMGVLTVAAAGNCGDFPFCTGTPAAAPTALSVAQTEVPSAKAFFMAVIEPADQADLYDAVKYPWTPEPTTSIMGTVQYGDLDGSNLDGCLPFSGDLSGMIVAVDRGACNFSDKIRNIENAGGVLGIVMLITPEAPFAGGFGGGDPINIPGFNISQADGDILRAGSAIVEFAPDLSYSLAGTTVSSTARGPDMSFLSIKPEIGAPGASISAEVGTGTSRTAFGGTSGATPMVAGSAALVLEVCEKRYKKYRKGHYNHFYLWKHKKRYCSPQMIKNLLVNYADNNILSDTTGDLAEITRIGGGEVRVDRAVLSEVMAWSMDSKQPTLSLGYIDVSEPVTVKKKLMIENVSRRFQFIFVEPGFRFSEDEETGAVKLAVNRPWIKLGPWQKKAVTIEFEIDPAKLSGNPLNSGSAGNDPASLTAAEYDGYIKLHTLYGNNVTVPWHVIPRQAAEVSANTYELTSESFPETVELVNNGAGIAQNNSYAIVALSDQQPSGGRGEERPTPDIRAVGVSTIPTDPGFCSAEFLWEFAINTWKQQTRLLPVLNWIDLDTNQDGFPDYAVFNYDLDTASLADGRQLSWVLNYVDGSLDARFFAEHATKSGNTILRVCGEQLGLSSADILATNIKMTVYADDFYFGGQGDVVENIVITPLGERFYGLASDLLSGESGAMDVYDFGVFPGNTDESGVMLITNGDRGTGASGGATEDTETLLFLRSDVKPPAPLP